MIRDEFPILSQKINGKKLVYLDNAATTQKPKSVISAITRFYEEDCANIHRGVHALSQRATKVYEDTRETVRKWIGASRVEEIVYTRGTTDGINLVAHTYVRSILKPGDEILISEMEHHSNIVPWQLVTEQTGATLRVIPMTDEGTLQINDVKKSLTEKTRFIAISHVSNALGTINPIREIISLAHERGAKVLIDGAQGVPHMRVNVKELDCDFYVFSGHKIYGPTGISALYGKYELLEKMTPYQGGGDMITSVTFKKTEYQKPPQRFEAGTPNIAGVYGLKAAIEFIEKIGIDQIAKHEKELLHYATERLSTVPDLRIIGTSKEKAAVISFVLGNIHPHDVGTILDQQGIAVRAGHHCAQPVMDHFHIPATTRASFAIYNTREEIDALIDGLTHVRKVFG